MSRLRLEALRQNSVVGPSCDQDSEDFGHSDFEDDEIGNAKGIVASAVGESTLSLKRDETTVPVVSPEEVCDVEFILDTGADYDVLNKKRALAFNEHLRKMRQSVTFDTAGGERRANDGARIQVAWWDGPNDFLLLKDSPSLMSIGSRCQSGQYTFVWVRSKHYACFVDAPRRKIIVFPVRGNIPL